MIGNVTSLPKEPPRFFNRGPSALARLTFFGVASLALMFVDAKFKTLEAVRVSISTIVNPLQQLALVPGNALNSIGDFFETRTALRTENAELKKQLLESAQIEQASRAAQLDAQKWRALAGAAQTISVKSQPSKVLYLGRDPYSQKFFIERGVSQNFESGAAVIDGFGLLGQVTRTHPLLAEVTLLTDKDFAVPIRIERTGMRALLYGRGPAQPPELRYVANNADIVEGDIVLTSSIDGVFPANLRVCKIARVTRERDNLFAKIDCSPFAGVTSAEDVLVLDRPAMPPPRPAEEAAAKNAAKRKGG
ncbi:MAG: rod shape-determining protein MreC [Casimicrobium sp.]